MCLCSLENGSRQKKEKEIRKTQEFSLTITSSGGYGRGTVLAMFKRESLKAEVRSKLGGSYCFRKVFMHVGLSVS